MSIVAACPRCGTWHTPASFLTPKGHQASAQGMGQYVCPSCSWDPWKEWLEKDKQLVASATGGPPGSWST
jgi:hypothetical protein